MDMKPRVAEKKSCLQQRSYKITDFIGLASKLRISALPNIHGSLCQSTKPLTSCNTKLDIALLQFLPNNPKVFMWFMRKYQMAKEVYHRGEHIHVGAQILRVHQVHCHDVA